MIAQIAFRIAAALHDGDLVYLADDEQQAERIADAVRGLVPAGQVIFLPASDTLPGDVAPPSPENAGHRVAALRALRQAQQQAERGPLALILSGEAAARRYPPPDAYDGAPPTLRPGDAIDVEAFAAQVETLGYFADDRVDEPGEVAILGEVIDIFPADAGLPVRIEVADGAIAALRSYDPLTQRTVGELDRLEIGHAAEPALSAPVAILAHLRPARIARSVKADKRRKRFIQLATETAGHAGGRIDAIDDAAWAQSLATWQTLELETAETEIPRFAEARRPLAAFTRFVQPLLESRALVLAGSTRDLRFLRTKVAQRLKVDLAHCDDRAAIEALDAGAAATIVMPVDRGFVDARLVVVAAADILGSRAQLDDAPVASVDLLTGAGADIRVGDIVVHEDHGVARIAGLAPAPEGSEGGELIALEYAGGARRLVAVDDADRIWRYGANDEAVSLDKLDGSSWIKRRAVIDAAINESARGLARLAEARAGLEAPAIDPDPATYERFANGFAYTETADQARAIGAVRTDLASGKPMDRLIVGDVGYGKTEVALRAAALAALAGYQVVVAAPTTVLVRQHLESFMQRFEGTDIRVAGLSRLSTAAEKKAVKAGLADGSIGIVVGTGAVMGKGVHYAKLGLVVIDEEQRFGAADKARLRGSGETHLLTLSATPIPRTLQMALVGLQQVSVIVTPPTRRQPIRTSLDQYDDARIRTALRREKSRGGQSFVVVPRIEDMAPLAEKLRRIAPELTLVEAHGKMPAAEIDEAMVRFAGGAGDILLATNIIEAGLDVPRANTMIVWRADRFGLAQLHQLRGRVGRGNRRGQVILLTQGEDAIGARTLKRLRALAAHDRLGAGFDISAADLDMRGAGDLLGDDQAGHMTLIGTQLYQYLLGAALRSVRGEPVERWAPELHIGEAGCLPEHWIPEPDARLNLYVRLARIEEEGDLDAFEEELLDRFGPLPPQAERLVARARIRRAARALGILRIDAGPAAIALTPRAGFEGNTKAAGLKPRNGRLILAEATEDADRSARIQALLDTLEAAKD
ncbi:helicase-related protein [Sphingomonas sp. ST-64]|uniref:Transcription-repair-coupling factor n=1 Tax=Sphingomonas plantiphila TaxID=3163295 RepID=A0ABW8YP46_9SPHN